MANIVALLDSMWGWGGYHAVDEEAPAYFRINPDNHSGRRLYSLVGDHNLLVTNCCKTVQATANHHGDPDPIWVDKNLSFLCTQRMDLLLVCGRVSKATFRSSSSRLPALSIGFDSGRFKTRNMAEWRKYLAIDHPAARRWSKASIESTRQEIERLCRVNLTSSK